jgi:acyl carrier protein
MFSKSKKKKDNINYLGIAQEAIKQGTNGEVDISILQPTTLFEDVGINSIQYINILICLEECLGIEIENIIANIDFSTIKTLQDFIDLIKNIKENA